ncbi:minichromosome maintenance protein MCM [Candidatus Nitrosocosmicus sp. SS]|jgi:replicative DNA helicase Mcm|uniref:minichromosome maintenance protein MCM n=1 Tax=Candidatus Nitrosocosmicus agrestis TaxID=2563600 RepID=UPI00122DED49|nr:minichromosome maintenance protein MCM [Candidatus Nitrosocosmicus sp. SS]KAF0870264.1 minichromosome maintenance protein MCM [Candidatus Nitrosocosmicus sp. SS]
MQDQDQEQQTISALSNELEIFLRSYKDREGNYKYFDKINNMMATSSTSITVDYIDFDSFSPALAKDITYHPDEMFSAFSESVTSILLEIHPDYAHEIKDHVKVRIGNYAVQKGLRDISADVINKLLGVSGMVVRSSEVKPLGKRLAYRCLNCNQISFSQLKGLSLKKPMRCTSCAEKELEMDIENSLFIDFQLVRLQELPEDLPAGQLPHYIEVTILGDLVDQCRPGDRIMLTGIIRIDQEPSFGGTSALQKTSLFRLRMEGNNIEYLGGRAGDKKTRSMERISISAEDERQILMLSNKPDIYDKLISSFAPHVFGHEVIKESILLLIVGSVTKKLDDGSTRRGDINVLLVGDPGTAKSEMLKFAAKVAPRGLYTSGRGSTAAGLTAAVVRDKSGIMMLEAGAVVLGDQGLVCIDEFDKIKAEDRSALHEVMEQQTCSVAKGGIVATLNARTSILSAANPMYGKYDPYKNITENVNLPIPLLTRFDLVYVIRDLPEKDKDSKIASHILEIHKDVQKSSQGAINIDLFSKYLAFAKQIVEPELTREAINIIRDYYMTMRNVDSDSMITVTPRQLEGLVRLATARARLLLKERVEQEDAERALFLVQRMLETAGVDVNTGKVDLGVLHGKPFSEISKLKLFMEIFLSISGEEKNDVEENVFIGELVKTGKFNDSDARSYIKKAMNDGQIYERKPGFYSKA